MWVGVVSDIHLEFNKLYYRDLPHWIWKHAKTNFPNDVTAEKPFSLDVLCVCGDVCPIATHRGLYVEFIRNALQIAKVILLVAGNHEFYGSSIEQGLEELRQAVSLFALDRVKFLENEFDTVNETVRIYGATLWSSIPEPLEDKIEKEMNDYREIQNFRPSDCTALHKNSCKFLADAVREGRADKRIHTHIVMTHHCPCFEVLDPAYRDPVIDHAYATPVIRNILPDYWFCGHTHQKCDWTSPDGVQVILNPRGYESSGNYDFIRIIHIDK